MNKDVHNEFRGMVQGSIVQAGSIEGGVHIHQDATSVLAPDRAVSADALMRGPINAIEGLAGRVATGEQTESTNPAAAASAYGEVAASLESHGYHGHALLMRQRAATTLETGGDTEGAVALLVQLVEEMISAGEAGEAAAPVHRLHRLITGGTLSPDTAGRATATLSLYTAVQHPLDELSDLVAAVETLAAADDASLPVYALVLAEAAVATEQPAVILDRVDIFARAGREAGTEAVKIRICVAVAEACDDWQDLVELARRHQFAPAWKAVVLARYARRLTLDAKPDKAAEHWWDAINAGALAGLGDDTAEWLYAVRENTARYGPITDRFETHHLAQAMRANGGRLIPAARNHYEDALANLRATKLLPACQAARRALREAVTAGYLLSEHLAAQLLADIYAEAGEPERAAELYVRIGQRESLNNLLNRLGDHYIDMREHLVRRRPWQRATAYAALTTQADLIPDEQVVSITSAALDDFDDYTAGRTREGPFAPQVGLAALDALAALIERATSEQAQRAVKLLAPLVPRQAERYRHTDELHIRLLAGILTDHAELRSGAAEQLLDMLAMNEPISDKVVDIAGGAIKQHPELFLDRLAALASDGHASARLLTALDRCLPDSSTLARHAFDRLIAPYQQPPGVTAIGVGLAQDAMLVRHLPEPDRDTAAQALLARARDHNEVAVNRADALAALRILSDVTSSALRAQLFEAGIAFGRGDEDGSALDHEFGEPAHPLSNFRISFGETSLAIPGLHLAAVTCTAHEAEQVENLAFNLLGSGNDAVVHGATLALLWLPDHSSAVPAHVLVVHPRSDVRALAAIRWVRQSPRDTDLGLRLAHDIAPVRRALASAISTNINQTTDGPLVTICDALRADPRQSVRRLVVSAPVRAS